MANNSKKYSEDEMKEIIQIASEKAIETTIEGLSKIAVTASKAATKK